MSSFSLHNLSQCPGCNAEGLTLKEVYGIPVCEKCAPKCFSEKVREKIQINYDRLVERGRRELWNKRIELVKSGSKYFQEKKFIESLHSYSEYLAILESHYRVPQGGLQPGLFDSKKEAGDILLISGIYWDLVKIYDRMKNKGSALQHAINKYVEFSLNRPHLVLSCETLRKYIKSGDAQHKNLLENAYKVLQENLTKCYLASVVYGPLSEEVTVLRTFRDQFLKKYPAGRTFIKVYYRTSPPIAKALVKNKKLQGKLKKILDPMVRICKIISE